MIRIKLMLCILLSILILSVVMYFIATSIILKSYLTIEQNLNEQNLVRLDQAIKDYNTSMQIKLRDWSHWDDTYVFANDGNSEYKDANLQTETLENLEINVMLFVNLAKSVVFVKNVDLEFGDEMEGYNLAGQILKHNVATHNSVDSSIGGLIEVDGRLFFVESLPILKNNGDGPTTGTIIFGRFFDAQMVAKLSELTQLKLELFKYNDTDLPDDVQTAKNLLPDSEGLVTIPLDDNTMGGYLLLNDITDTPIGIIRVTLPREIYIQGSSTLTTFIVTSSIFILLFGLLIIALIQRLVFSRLTRLNNEILSINAESSMDSAKVSEGRKDEMGTLARKINDMLKGLFSAQANERRAHQLQMEAAELLKKQQEDAENMSRVMVEREIKMNELNNEIAELRNQIPK